MAAQKPPAGSREILAIRGIGKTSNSFRWALLELGDRLGVDPSFIAAVMAIESGFDPKARNPVSNASGLIQFMPFYLRRLKPPLSPEAVRAMGAIEQLALVERFYRPHARRMRTVCDAYLATFMPIAIGMPESAVLGRKDSDERITPGAPTMGAVYKQNIGFDPKPKGGGERRGFFTVGDVCAPVRSVLTVAEAKPRIAVHPEAAPRERKGGAGSAVGAFLFGLFAAVLLARKKRATLAG